MAEQQFNPGVSLAGAVDLEALKHQVKAEPDKRAARLPLVVRDRHHRKHLPGNGADFCDLPDPAAPVDTDR